MNKLLGTKIGVKDVTDTLVLSRMFNPERLGGHSLANLGKILKCPKGDFNDFSKFTEEMLTYCVQDVHVTKRIYDWLMKTEGYQFSKQSIRKEHSVAAYIKQMERNGFAFDSKKASLLFAEVSDNAERVEKEIKQYFNIHEKFIRNITPKYRKDGTLSPVGLSKLSDEIVATIPILKPDDHDTNPLVIPLIEQQEFNLNSPQQIVARLNDIGWKPYLRTKGFFVAEKKFKKGIIDKKEFDEVSKRSWKICIENLETVPDDAPAAYKKFAEWKMYYSRVSWLRDQCFSHVKEDRIYGHCNPLGAVTHRMTHNGPNLANITGIKYDKKGVLLKGATGKYGYECRDLFTVAKDKDRVLLGTDASGLELRMLAHYMADEGFSQSVVEGSSKNGTDVHSVNQRNAGLSTRDAAKTFIYAFLYGAGAAKIGSIVDGGAKEGQALKDKFLKMTPKLSLLIRKVQHEAKRKRIRGLDGRYLNVRHSHAALNTLLQSAGAIVCKYWLCEIMKEVAKQKLDVKLVAAVHDEYQFDCHKNSVEAMSEICKQAMIDTGLLLKLTLPLAADVSIGDTWAGTH